MALPTSMGPFRDPLKKTGIVLGVFASTSPEADLELWRSTQTASTATSNWTITRYPPSTKSSYTLPILLPLSTKYHYFKARSQQLGYRASTFTPTVRGRSVIFSQYPASPNVPTNNDTAIELPVPIFMNSNQTMEVGAPSQVSPTTYIEKTLVVKHNEFQPLTHTTRASYGLAWVTTLATTSQVDFTAVVTLPNGCQTRTITARFYRGSTAQLAEITMYNIGATGTAGVGTAITSTATGWHNKVSSSTALIQQISTANNLAAGLTLRGSSFNAARFMSLEVVYRVPRYSVAV